MRRPRESVAEAVGRPRTEESAKNPIRRIVTKAARGNREPYNDDRNVEIYALRLRFTFTIYLAF